MSKDEINEKIDEFFVKDSEQVILDNLERMKGWFSFDKQQIHVGEDVQNLPGKWKYLNYLLAAFVSDFRGYRDSPAVEHSEADEYFGWDGKAEKRAYQVSSFIADGEDGGKMIPPGSFEKAISKIEAELEDDE